MQTRFCVYHKSCREDFTGFNRIVIDGRVEGIERRWEWTCEPRPLIERVPFNNNVILNRPLSLSLFLFSLFTGNRCFSQSLK